MLRRSVRFAVAVGVAVTLAACDGGTDFEPIEPDGNAADAEPEPDDEPEPEVEEPEDDVPEVFQGQLYPPLPELEPDPNAGDIEPQQEVLAAHRVVYDAVETAFATNEYDEDELLPLIGGDFEASFAESFGSQREAGTVSLSPDGEVVWVDVISADAEEVVLGKCLVIGPATGSFDEVTGEPTFDDDPDYEAELVRTYTYTRTEGAWVATGFTATFQEGCREV